MIFETVNTKGNVVILNFNYITKIVVRRAPPYLRLV